MEEQSHAQLLIESSGNYWVNNAIFMCRNLKLDCLLDYSMLFTVVKYMHVGEIFYMVQQDQKLTLQAAMRQMI